MVDVLSIGGDEKLGKKYLVKRKCFDCEQEYQPVHDSQKFCSILCSMRNTQKQARKLKMEG